MSTRPGWEREQRRLKRAELLAEVEAAIDRGELRVRRLTAEDTERLARECERRDASCRMTEMPGVGGRRE